MESSNLGNNESSNFSNNYLTDVAETNIPQMEIHSEFLKNLKK